MRRSQIERERGKREEEQGRTNGVAAGFRDVVELQDGVGGREGFEADIRVLAVIMERVRDVSVGESKRELLKMSWERRRYSPKLWQLEVVRVHNI